MSQELSPIGWVGIVRLGLIQAGLGSVVVLTTSLLNRVMVVELGLMALLPGALVALYYSLQILRPRLGYGSDQSGRQTPWIIGGMAVLALGGASAALATAWMNQALLPGIALAAFSFVLIALGVGAAGTNLLVLLAKRVEARRRPAAATIVWLMMIVGFIVTTATASQLLDPFTLTRLVAVSTGVSVIAFLVSLAAIWGVEGRAPATADLSANARRESNDLEENRGQVRLHGPLLVAKTQTLYRSKWTACLHSALGRCRRTWPR